ncbi:MAG TPA: hypothetical protein VHR47_02160 [Bacillota bacterium]|nr:hypothetical protein [Bacillota bacterium]
MSRYSWTPIVISRQGAKAQRNEGKKKLGRYGRYSDKCPENKGAFIHPENVSAVMIWMG